MKSNPMRMPAFIRLLAFFFAFFALTACGGGGSAGGVSVVNHAPEFVALAFDVLENRTQVTAAIATDADGGSLSFSIVGGADAAAFTLDAATGAASFVMSPDFENPADANADNSFEVEVEVSDGETSVTKMVTVNVVNENSLQVAITYPSPANDLKAWISKVFVFGRLVDLEDGVVEADDINFLDVNGMLVMPDPADPSRWSTRIDAPIGVSTLKVTVESSSGQQHTVSQELRNQFKFEAPGPVALDSANNRAFVLDTGLNAIVEVNLATGTRKLLSSANPATQVGDGPGLADGSSISLDSANHRLLVSREGLSEYDYRIFINGHFLAVDLATGNRSYLSSASNGVGSGPGTDVAMDIIADPLNDRLLGIAYDGTTYNYGAGSGICPPTGICLFTSQRDILAIDGISGDRSIFSGSLSGDAIKLALDSTNNRLFELNGSPTREINVVDLDTGTESPLSGPATPGRVMNTPTDLAINANGSKAFFTDLMASFLPSSGTNRASVIEVDGVTGAQTILSSIDDGAGINLDQPAGIAIDDANDRAIVTDKGLPAVLGVSLSSGDRSVLSGSVPQINYPSAVLADPANQRVFVGTGLGQDTIFAVDLQTGALDVVSDATNAGQPILSKVEAMGLDATNNLLYFVDSGALQKVDLASGDRTLISGYNSGTGLDVGGGPEMITIVDMALDLANNRAYVLDQYDPRLFAIDLDTGIRTIVADNVSAGTGQAFISPADMAADIANRKAYVGDVGDNSTGGGFIVEVDLVSGDRTVIANNTGIGTGLGTLSFISGQSIAYDTVKQRLLHSAGPIAIDIATGDRESIANNSGLSPSQLGPPFAGGIEDIAFDPANERIYLTERLYSGVFEVELTIAARGVVAQ